MISYGLRKLRPAPHHHKMSIKGDRMPHLCRIVHLLGDRYQYLDDMAELMPA
jgi:hypothetical protein